MKNQSPQHRVTTPARKYNHGCTLTIFQVVLFPVILSLGVSLFSGSSLSLPFVTFVTAQDIIVGTDLCACQPITYEFTLDLNSKCSATDINMTMPGIEDSGCVVESRGSTENITNPFPSIVNQITIVELNQNKQPIAQTIYDEAYQNGDIIYYNSIMVTAANTIPENVPRAIQLTISGLNDEEVQLTNSWIIYYENDCGIFPIVNQGQRIGWTIFVSVLLVCVFLCVCVFFSFI